jgi:hypothetical protein
MQAFFSKLGKPKGGSDAKFFTSTGKGERRRHELFLLAW